MEDQQEVSKVPPPDWNELERKFVLCWLTGPDFAKKHGIPFCKVEYRMKCRRWTAKREEVQARLSEETTRAAIRRRQRAEAVIDTQSNRLANGIIERIGSHLRQSKTLTTDKTGVEALEKTYRLLREINELTPEKPPPAELDEEDGPIFIVRHLADDTIEIRHIYSALLWHCDKPEEWMKWLKAHPDRRPKHDDPTANEDESGEMTS